MTLILLKENFAVCKLKNLADADLKREIYFLAVTMDEISLVCHSKDKPAEAVAVEDGWRGFKADGTLDFSLVGVLSGISGILADSDISIFVMSTFNTDYIFVKSDKADLAVSVLSRNGYYVREER